MTLSFQLKFGTLDMSDAVESWEQSLDTRLNQMLVPKRHGVLISEVPVVGARMVRLKGRTQAVDFTTLRTTIDLMEKLLNAGRQKLFLAADRFLYAYKASFGYGYVPGAALAAIDFSIDFLCDDPFFYDTTSQSDVRSLTTGDTNMGGGFYKEAFIHTNPGTVFAYPIITVNANQGVSLTKVIFRNLTNTRTFQYTGTVVAGTSLVIDCGNLSVRNNGVEDLANWNGLFATLDVGANSLEIEGNPATYTIAYTARYY